MSFRLPGVVCAVLGLSAVCGGCGSSALPASPSSPSGLPAPVAPGPPAPSPQPIYYTLSGIVSETSEAGRKAVVDVEVYCDSCGSPQGHTFVRTNTQGFYSFSWTANGVHPLLVRKAGYAVVNPVQTFPDGTGVRHAAVTGDTSFDIEVVQR